MRRYSGIDFGRVFFASIIPFLHISFPDSIGIVIAREYIARLGVPFFFAVSGMFLIKSIASNGAVLAYKRYSKRIGILLVIWLLIYSPLLVFIAIHEKSIITLIQQLYSRHLHIFGI